MTLLDWLVTEMLMMDSLVSMRMMTALKPRSKASKEKRVERRMVGVVCEGD